MRPGGARLARRQAVGAGLIIGEDDFTPPSVAEMTFPITRAVHIGADVACVHGDLAARDP
jgi:hypothetical protein